MAKRKPSHLFDKLTSANLYVSYNIGKDMFEKSVKKYIGVDENVEDSYAKCILYKTGGNSIVWIWTSTDDLSALVHECTHAAQYIFELINTPINDDTAELFAYYVQWIFKEGYEKEKVHSKTKKGSK